MSLASFLGPRQFPSCPLPRSSDRSIDGPALAHAVANDWLHKRFVAGLPHSSEDYPKWTDQSPTPRPYHESITKHIALLNGELDATAQPGINGSIGLSREQQLVADLTSTNPATKAAADATLAAGSTLIASLLADNTLAEYRIEDGPLSLEEKMAVGGLDGDIGAEAGCEHDNGGEGCQNDNGRYTKRKQLVSIEQCPSIYRNLLAKRKPTTTPPPQPTLSSLVSLPLVPEPMDQRRADLVNFYLGQRSASEARRYNDPTILDTKAFMLGGLGERFEANGVRVFEQGEACGHLDWTTFHVNNVPAPRHIAGRPMHSVSPQHSTRLQHLGPRARFAASSPLPYPITPYPEGSDAHTPHIFDLTAPLGLNYEHNRVWLDMTSQARAQDDSTRLNDPQHHQSFVETVPITIALRPTSITLYQHSLRVLFVKYCLAPWWKLHESASGRAVEPLEVRWAWDGRWDEEAGVPGAPADAPAAHEWRRMQKGERERWAEDSIVDVSHESRFDTPLTVLKDYGGDGKNTVVDLGEPHPCCAASHKLSSTEQCLAAANLELSRVEFSFLYSHDIQTTENDLRDLIGTIGTPISPIRIVEGPRTDDLTFPRDLGLLPVLGIIRRIEYLLMEALLLSQLPRWVQRGLVLVIGITALNGPTGLFLTRFPHSITAEGLQIIIGKTMVRVAIIERIPVEDRTPEEAARLAAAYANPYYHRKMALLGMTELGSGAEDKRFQLYVSLAKLNRATQRETSTEGLHERCSRSLVHRGKPPLAPERLEWILTPIPTNPPPSPLSPSLTLTLSRKHYDDDDEEEMPHYASSSSSYLNYDCDDDPTPSLLAYNRLLTSDPSSHSVKRVPQEGDIFHPAQHVYSPHAILTFQSLPFHPNGDLHAALVGFFRRPSGGTYIIYLGMSGDSASKAESLTLGQQCDSCRKVGLKCLMLYEEALRDGVVEMLMGEDEAKRALKVLIGLLGAEKLQDLVEVDERRREDYVEFYKSRWGAL